MWFSVGMYFSYVAYFLDAPTLSSITECDVSIFACRSAPIAAKARQTHAEQMALLHQPWWRNLQDEHQNREYKEEDSENWKIF